MFEFLTLWWVKLVGGLYFLFVVLTITDAICLRHFRFVFRTVMSLGVVVFLVWLGEYVRLNESVPHLFDIFSPESIWLYPPLVVGLCYTIATVISLYVLLSLIKVFPRVPEDKRNV